MAVNVISADKKSIAEKYGIYNCKLLSINGNNINDVFDYEFYTKEKQLSIEFIVNNKTIKISVNKDEYEPLGCNFSTYLIDKKHSCKNNCIFCFIDQLPKGLRKELYFKDDDERLSFLFGNYITLTNLSSKEIERIINMRISPINISVHTVDECLRISMMKNKNSGNVLRYIDEFAAADIKMNFQLVLCADINDGDKLVQSIEKLGSYFPNVQSIACVPLGLTKHRDNLPVLKAYDENSAKKQLEIMLYYGDLFYKKHGARLVYPSDEWFILAKMPIPDYNFYEDYPQLENGVGMWRKVYSEFEDELNYQQPSSAVHEYDLVTGEIAKPLAKQLCNMVKSKFKNINITVHPVKNNFFGGNVNVTGLLTGQDIIQQLSGKLQTKSLLLPENLLRDENDLLLDDVSINEIEKKLGVSVKILPQNGSDALLMILNKEVQID